MGEEVRVIRREEDEGGGERGGEEMSQEWGSLGQENGESGWR